MCTVSMVGDFYGDKWGKQYPQWSTSTVTITGVSKQEFNELKKEVLDMKELLKRALKYDEDNNEPHCEMEEKVALLKKVAELVGVNLEEIFGPVK